MSVEVDKGEGKGNQSPEFIVAQRLFHSLDVERKGYILKEDIFKALSSLGIHRDDPRIKELRESLDMLSKDSRISQNEFIVQIRPNIVLIEKAITRKLIIPDFESFCGVIENICNATKKNCSGHVADYIPQLKRINPEQFGVSLCTIDGQRFSWGDFTVPFCVQSTSKPITYCLAIEEHGEDEVHKYVGREPSGRGFNELTLNQEGLPHNPLINAGAIMTCALIKPDLDVSDRFDYVLQKWKELCFSPITFNNAVYLSEKHTADRNFALGYFMKEAHGFPPKTSLQETLEFYFQCCSLEINCEAMAVLAATLANSGIGPLSGKKIFNSNTVKNCLSLMYSCGMYDFSGEFAFTVGVPAKSGVSGVLMVVIPHVMGIALWSPRLDSQGNSVRGVEFCRKLVENFNFHNYDSLVQCKNKIDPRYQKNEIEQNAVAALCWAASQGDLNELKRLVANGIDLNAADYDGRTALHLAASGGQLGALDFIIKQNVDLNPIDRWGSTPLDDAYREQHREIIELLEKCGARSEKQQLKEI